MAELWLCKYIHTGKTFIHRVGEKKLLCRDEIGEESIYRFKGSQHKKKWFVLLEYAYSDLIEHQVLYKKLRRMYILDNSLTNKAARS